MQWSKEYIFVIHILKEVQIRIDSPLISLYPSEHSLTFKTELHATKLSELVK